MKFTIDRFEEDFAVVENDKRQMQNIPRSLMPQGANEGDCVMFESGTYTLIDNSSDRARIQSKFDRLKQK